MAYERTTGELCVSRSFVILGLSGLAVTQPLLDLFGRNPQFFIAGNYSRAQIILFAVLIALVPALVGICLTSVATVLNRRAGTVVFAIVTALLGAAFLLALLRTLEVDSVALVFTLALAGGVGIAVLIARARGVRLLVSYLAVANLLFVGSFLFFSPTSDLLAGGGETSDELGVIEVPPVEGPVVLLVLDEFPAATIMRADGSLNSDRYPGFAELARVSTWFRNASSPYNRTHHAVPMILTGTVGDEDDMPTYQTNPRNLFTLLGDDIPVRRYEPVTAMCPPSVCEPAAHQPLTQAIEDASVVYGHRVLPTSIRADLPAIDTSWGDFGANENEAGTRVVSEVEDESDPSISMFDGASDVHPFERALTKFRHLRETDEGSVRGQAAVMAEETTAIDGSPGLHFVHALLPHVPWMLSRTGMLASRETRNEDDPDAPGFAFRIRFDYQRHSMQLGATDTLIGELLDHLRSLPTWEDTLLVVTSDHGLSLTPPDVGRFTVTDANRDEVYRVPLFIKAPGQLRGDIRDDSAQTIDVLPSIVDLLDIDTQWTFDGHSLYDGSTAHTEPQVSPDVDGAIAIARRHAEDFPYGDDWTALAAVGDNGDLVGRRVDELAVGEPSRYRATLSDQSIFADLPTANGLVPYVLVGSVAASDGPKDEPPELLAAVNGTVAGVVGGYRADGGRWAFVGYVADFYRDGANEVELYEVVRDGSSVTLHPAT